jgi:hypothetical protein
MNKNFEFITITPSFIGFLFNGLLLGIAILLFLFNYKLFDNKELLMIALVGSIAVGIHSMLHFREEEIHNFNPIKKLFY